MARQVQCVKLKREAEGLDFPPYPGDLGKRIFESVSKEAWKQWLEQQKMLVNENRLNLADKKARDYLAQQMERHFFGSGADAAPYFRIQNPWLQSARFDPDGVYIKQWVPELQAVPAALLHEVPKNGTPLAKGYPLPILDHSTERDRCLAIFAKHKNERR